MPADDGPPAPVAQMRAAHVAETARLSGAGVAVTELSLHLPSLDEVFFTLTGSPRTEQGNEKKEEVAA
jgi:oleandomycin transport system ATP-binding protein